MLTKFAFCLLPAVVLLGACTIDPKNYETTPVTVDSAKGPVTCQLYTKEMLTWDRAIGHSGSMSVEEADAICKAKGAEQQAAK